MPATTTPARALSRGGRPAPGVQPAPPALAPAGAAGCDADAALAHTASAAGVRRRCPQVGPYSALVRRSLLTLKAMTYAPTGGIVAGRHHVVAGTARRRAQLGLPFLLAARRHHDLAGIHEPGLFRRGPGLARMAAALGGRQPNRCRSCTAWVASATCRNTPCPGCRGYEHSQPVRVGNAASAQAQLDIYGELADAMSRAIKGGLPRHPQRRHLSADPALCGAYLARAGRRYLGGARRPPQFVHSR